MEIEVATWLAELVQQAVYELNLRPGLTIEVEDDPANWLQIVPFPDDDNEGLSGYLLNMPYREETLPPLKIFAEAGIMPPPGTEVVAWESKDYVTLRVQPDVPLVAFALFAGEILEKIGGAPADYEINVQIMHGL